MESIRLKTRVGQDGVLRLEVPLPVSSRELEVVLVYGPSTPPPAARPAALETTTAWPEDFFSEIAGGWQGDTLVRPPQGSFESRPPLK